MGNTIQLDGAEVYYEQHGKVMDTATPVLVLIHGYLSSCFSFRHLLPFIEKDYTIFSLDLPGFGQSEKSRTFVYSLENYGRLVLNFLKQIDVEKAVLVGHSMGGQVALNAAKQGPDRIPKVVGLAASGYMGRVKRSLVLASYLPFSSRIIKRYFEKRDIMETFMEVTSDRSILTQDMIVGYLEPLKPLDFYYSLIRLARDREGDLPTEIVKTIEQPVLLIWGREDHIVPLPIGERFMHDLPNADLHILDHTGHLLPEEKPEDVARLIKQFLI